MRDLQITFTQYKDSPGIIEDLGTGETIFSTAWIDGNDEKVINSDVINNVVEIWNKTGNEDCIFVEGGLDEYLLNEGKCYQEEREIIVEAFANYCNEYDHMNTDFAKFESWMNQLPVQTLTDELKREIVEYVSTIIDM